MTPVASTMSPAMTFPAPASAQLGGLLGRAVELSRSAHLAKFISDPTSPPIALFRPECVAHNHEGDWYGEHAGKWLYAAARAAVAAPALGLVSAVRRVADFLVQVQEADGYLGTYAPSRRFMCQRGQPPRTWDGAPAVRTWDIWVHSYLILGLLEAGKLLSEPRYLNAARRIGDLCWHTLTQGGIRITSLGNHFGLSATVLLDPAVELYLVTGEKRYLELAELILRQANEEPALDLVPQALAGVDAAAIATGKAYQLLWNLVGLAKLYRATSEPRYLQAVRKLWENIREHHLTLGGGPWGGVAHRSREVFNPPTVFSPHGYVETCSTLSWIQLNRELLGLTGEARFAEEIEKAAYNDLLGAQSPEGDNWCYYSFPNGRRVFTTYWRCCKSSGPLALEELPPLAYAVTAEGHVAVNFYGASTATLPTSAAGVVRLEQVTDFPFHEEVRIAITPERAATFSLLLRVPSWTEGATCSVNGESAFVLSPDAKGYAVVERRWQSGDSVWLRCPMSPRLHRRTSRSLQESRAPDGTPVSQEVMHYDFIALTRGPLTYATGLVDGYKVDETIRVEPERWPKLIVESAPAGFKGPAIRMELSERAPLLFSPYFEAGEPRDGTWRLTWLRQAPV